MLLIVLAFYVVFLVGSVLLIFLAFCVVLLVGSVLLIFLVFCVVFLVGSVLLIFLVFYVGFLFCVSLRPVPCVPSVFSFVFVFVLCLVYPVFLVLSLSSFCALCTQCF